METRKNSKLIKMLIDKGSNQRKLAELLGLSYAGVQWKVKGWSDFTSSEIAKIKNAYNLSLEEIEDIFLKDE